MKILPILNPEKVSEKEASTYSIRNAARAIVIDKNNLIGLLHVSNDNYYKLPGGGLEGGEDPIVGLKRECKEELGCDISIIREVGSMVEYWKPDKQKQTSYCYLAKVEGETGIPNYTENELKRGFRMAWLSYKEAIRIMKESKPTFYEGNYIVPRDLAFLDEAGDYFASK